MNSCSRVIAFLFIILFLVAAPISLLFLNVDGYLLTPEPYVQALKDEDFAARIPGIVAEQLQFSMTYDPCIENPLDCEQGGNYPSESGAEGSGPPVYLRSLSANQWETILAVLLEPSWLEAQTENILTAFFKNLEPGSTRVPITVSLAEIKTSLAGTQGIELVETLLAAQPPCTASQLLELASLSLTQPDLDRLLTCNPPPEVLALLMPEIQSELNRAAQDLPSSVQIDILNSLFDSNSESTNVRELPLVRARLIMRFSPFIPLTFLLLAGLFAVRSVRALGLWIGIPLLIVGGTVAGVGWFAPGAVKWAVDQWLSPAIPGMLSPMTGTFFIDIVLRVGRLMAERMAFEGVVVLFVGAGILVVGLIVRPRRRIENIAPLTRPRDGANGGG